jgi:hypothetical protein
MYFEYELSPLNYELPILVPNIEGRAKRFIYSDNAKEEQLIIVTQDKRRIIFF